MSAEAPATLDLDGRPCVACGGVLKAILSDEARVGCACGAQYARQVQFGSSWATRSPARATAVKAHRAPTRAKVARVSIKPPTGGELPHVTGQAGTVSELFEWIGSVERRRDGLRHELATSIETALYGLCWREYQGRGRPWPTKISHRPKAALEARRRMVRA